MLDIYSHPPLHRQSSVHVNSDFLQRHLRLHFVLQLHFINSLHSFEASCCVIHKGTYTPFSFLAWLQMLQIKVF